MKQNGWSAAILISAGVLIGGATEWLYSSKFKKAERERGDKSYQLYLDMLKKYNEIVDDKNALDLELRQCKLTNWQVATYATQLKQRLDQFME